MRLQAVQERKPDGNVHAVADRRIQCGEMSPSSVLAATGYGTAGPKKWTSDDPTQSGSCEFRVRPTVDYVSRVESNVQ